jgi:pimeloyl-ACP methyl ester carboxylesterase
MKIRIAALLLLFTITHAAAQDYEREKRWADEVVPTIVVGEVVWLETGAGRKFLAIHTPVKNAKGSIVIVHGIGVHPDHGIIGVLRTKLSDLGWTTLSIQMPVQGSDAGVGAYYPALFPEAIGRIGIAATWMREHGAGKLVLVSHSMGSGMANAYFDATPQSPYVAWVCMGLSGGYTWATYFSGRPILDVYGEEDLPAVLGGAGRRAFAMRSTPAASRQVMIPAADHFYARKENELARAIDGWLATALR